VAAALGADESLASLPAERLFALHDGAHEPLVLCADTAGEAAAWCATLARAAAAAAARARLPTAAAAAAPPPSPQPPAPLPDFDPLREAMLHLHAQGAPLQSGKRLVLMRAINRPGY
jgi:hypothetical protein